MREYSDTDRLLTISNYCELVIKTYDPDIVIYPVTYDDLKSELEYIKKIADRKLNEAGREM